MRSFRTFLTEEVANYNLQSRFQHFNQVLFNGSIPADTTVGWGRLKVGVSGVTKCMVSRDIFGMGAKRVRPISITICDLYKSHAERLDGILIHEMIHAHFQAAGEFSENHGSKFVALATKFRAHLNITVPLTDNTDALELNDNVKNQRIVAIIRPDGAVAFITEKSFLQRQYSIDWLQGQYNHQLQMHVAQTNLHRRYKLCTSTKYLWFKIRPEDKAAIEKWPTLNSQATRLSA